MDHARGRNSLGRISNPLFEMCSHWTRRRCQRDTIHDSGLAFLNSYDSSSPPLSIQGHKPLSYKSTKILLTVDRRLNRGLHNSSLPRIQGASVVVLLFSICDALHSTIAYVLTSYLRERDEECYSRVFRMSHSWLSWFPGCRVSDGDLGRISGEFRTPFDRGWTSPRYLLIIATLMYGVIMLWL